MGLPYLTWAVTVAAGLATFLPPEFKVPARLRTKQFHLRQLTAADAAMDFEAVQASTEHLRGAFGPDSTWPPDDLTLEQNRAELRWHESEFDARRSFAYTVLAPDGSRVLGCVYVNPTRKRGFDAEVYLWVRTSAYEKGLDAVLYREVSEWLAREWPFERVAYPGRAIGWDEWAGLDERR